MKNGVIVYAFLLQSKTECKVEKGKVFTGLLDGVGKYKTKPAENNSQIGKETPNN